MTEKTIMRMAAFLGAVALLASCGPGDSTGGPASESSYESGKIKVISKGKAYATSDVVVPGKVVILEFTAAW